MSRNLDYLDGKPLESENVADKYMRVRHEDFSMEPFKVAEKIYKFIGIEMTEDVKTWLEKNTASGINSQGLSAQSTKRDSKTVASAWRNKLKFEHNEIIQDRCDDVLQKLQYRSFPSELDMKNLNISSF